MGEAADRIEAAISKALADHLADTGGGVVTGYAAAVEYIDVDGARSWALCNGDGQTPSTTLGLLRFHTISAEGDVTDYLRGLTD